MSDDATTNQRTEEQRRALAEAAALVAGAQREAMEILRRGGTELLPEEREWFAADRCMAQLPPPPVHHTCLCPRYRGSNGEPCRNTFTDYTEGDVDGGHAIVRCGHPQDSHGQI
ncbi:MULTISPECIES: DUF6422 family protein [unclassified Streptomyces]|uniref:DUF6422 family protein n=1 Tax=unclassified Streptomyces TaxID=2593676 RepID=UPI0036F1518B